MRPSQPPPYPPRLRGRVGRGFMLPPGALVVQAEVDRSATNRSRAFQQARTTRMAHHVDSPYLILRFTHHGCVSMNAKHPSLPFASVVFAPGGPLLLILT